MAYGGSQARGQIGLHLPTSVTTRATQSTSFGFKLHYSSGQHWILNPLSEARDRTCVLVDVRFVSLEPRQEHSSFQFFNSRFSDKIYTAWGKIAKPMEN